ncbi:hypothetical protein NZK35_33470 [Stieleria sp. ICT_E10.1]|uniref:hypothetical protein n=1 Tax=Stieleria sedimenti TaxID=2976331 RepID=UPI00217FB58D|nr:hypothetical protein [Stieleria sedimenti]MCS7471585.1 hypothetical protein [Stieleria sedimenti]
MSQPLRMCTSARMVAGSHAREASLFEMLETAVQNHYLGLMADVTQILAQIEHGDSATALCM